MNNREIEAKYVIQGMSMPHLEYLILSAVEDLFRDELVECKTMDIYFQASEGTSIRLRDSHGIGDNGFSRQLREFTVKKKDQGNNFNRIEENVAISDCAAMYEALKLVHGDPVLILHKEEVVIWTKDGMIFSMARVSKESDKIYFEIEGPTEELVNRYCDKFSQFLTMERETRSLFEIYGGKS